METMMWILVPLAAGNLICLLKLNFDATSTLKELSLRESSNNAVRGLVLCAMFLIAGRSKCLSMIKFESMLVNWKLFVPIKMD